MIGKKKFGWCLRVLILTGCICLGNGSSFAEDQLQASLNKIASFGTRNLALAYLSKPEGKEALFRLLKATPAVNQACFLHNVAGSRRFKQFEWLAESAKAESAAVAGQIFTLAEPVRSQKLAQTISLIEKCGADKPTELVSFSVLLDVLMSESLSANLADSSDGQAVLRRIKALKDQIRSVSSEDKAALVSTLEPEIIRDGWFDGNMESADLINYCARKGPTSTRAGAAPKLSTFGLPDVFLWGVSTSGYQWEGNCKTGCWPVFERSGKTEDICNDAADGYHRFAEDVSLAAGMGCNAFRTSIEWARIEPEPGVIDPAGIAFYHNLFAAMKKHGITPVVTLVHFSWPAWIETHCGGWQNVRSREAFARYVELVAKEYGSEVDWWLTFNEPVIIIANGYVLGGFPPGQKNPFTAARVAANWVACHKLAYKILHQFDKVAYVSFNNYAGTYSALGADLIFFDMQPAVPCDTQGVTASGNTDRSLPAVSGASFFDKKNEYLDYIALDYYCRWNLPGGFKPAASWEIYPKGFAECLKNYWKVFKLPVLVAENGMATENLRPRPDGWTREAFLVEHVREMQKAMAEGVPVIGYMHWSITDNYELGTFDQRFGLYSVECQSGDYTRVKTPAVEVYRQIIAANGVSPELTSAFSTPVRKKKAGR